MARSKSADPTTAGDKPKKKGRIAQVLAVFRMTRTADPAVVWWMLLAFVGTLGISVLIGFALGHPIYVTILSLPVALLLALVIMARRAESAAYAGIAGQPGASIAAMQSLRRGWVVDQEPVAVDPRTQDLVFRAVGRPGVVLVTEGPLPRITRLAEQERKRVARVLPNVPVHVLHAGDDEGQVPLRRLGRTMTKIRPALSKDQVSKVSQRLRALGTHRLPIPKGVDPLRARPDRRATRGR